MRNNYLSAVSSRTKKVSVNSFLSGFNSKLEDGVLPLSTAKRIYNFDFSSGALRDGLGIKNSGINAGAAANVWLYKRQDSETNKYQNIKMIALKNGKILSENPDGTFGELSGMTFKSTPFAVNYRLYGEDVILICSKEDGMAVWNGSDAIYKVEDSPLITSFAIHYERMFATAGDDNSMVWFSDDLDPTNWTCELDSGGFIQMLDERGGLNKVISFLNYVYIFRDYGISRLTAYADQSEFSATNLFVSSGKINAGTVAECGDTILFLAADGLYRFDGLSTVKQLSFLSGIIMNSPNATAKFHDGKYYLSLRLSLDDGAEVTGNSEEDRGNEAANNGMIIFDTKSGEYEIVSGINIIALSPIEDELYAVTADGRIGIIARCGSFFSKPSVKSWVSGMTDFGTDGIKVIKEFAVETDKPFLLKVKSERGEKEFTVAPSGGGITIVRINLSGRKIGFGIKTEAQGVRISRPKIKMSVN